ncbi:MAG: hypothetical protein ACTSWY_06415 [Promethearchaeota archaeon]
MIELEVKISDSPGALVKLVRPISENGGNIHGIIHNHKDKIKGKIPVLVRFEIISKNKKKSMEKIRNMLKDLNFQVLKITDIPAVHDMMVILSGHIFRKDLEDTIRRITKTGAGVHDLEAKFTTPDAESNVKFNVEIPDEIKDEEIKNVLKEICTEKDFVLLMEEKF